VSAPISEPATFRSATPPLSSPTARWFWGCPGAGGQPGDEGLGTGDRIDLPIILSSWRRSTATARWPISGRHTVSSSSSRPTWTPSRSASARVTIRRLRCTGVRVPRTCTPSWTGSTRSRRRSRVSRAGWIEAVSRWPDTPSGARPPRCCWDCGSPIRTAGSVFVVTIAASGLLKGSGRAPLVHLVTGSTGNIGRALVSLLLEQGHDVRALVRDAERAARLRRLLR